MTARTTDETDASPAPGPNASRHPHHEQSTTRSNNVSERGAKKAKRRQSVSGYWQSLLTLGRWCRVASYLDSAAAHGTGALDAVRAVIEGKPWLPPLPAIS